MEQFLGPKDIKEYKRRYEQCKSTVVKWEIAFSREKGQQPTKNDFRLAPRPVQVAYVTYLEIKRLLLKLSAGNWEFGCFTGSEVDLKNKPAESPARIFQRCSFNGKECLEEYNPALERSRTKALCSGIEGITPLPPSPKKSVLSPKMLAALPNLKFHFRTPSKNSKAPDKAVPFGKLSTKLFVQETVSSSKPVPIPRGKLERTVVAETDDTCDFSSELDSILRDVRKAVETYDKEDFDDDSAVQDSGDIDLGLSFGHLPEPKKTQILPQPSLEYSDKVESQQSFHFEKVSKKSRAMNRDWIERCHNLEVDDSGLPTEDSTPIGDQFLQEDIDDIINQQIAETVLKVNLDFPGAPSLPIASVPEPITVDSEEPKRITRSSRVPESSHTEMSVHTEENSPQNGKRKSKKTTVPRAVKAPKKAKKDKSVTENEKKVERKTPPQKRKAADITDFDFIDDAGEARANAGQKKGRKRIRLIRQKKTDDNFVRIDITKKLFVRGKKKMTGIQNKQINWKLKKKQVATENKIKLLKCKKCGGVGHFAKFCLKDLQEQNKEEEVDNSPFPSLEEAARMIWSKKASDASQNRTCIFNQPESQIQSQADPPQDLTFEASPKLTFDPSTQNSVDEGMSDSEVEASLVLVSQEDTIEDGSNTLDAANISLDASNISLDASNISLSESQLNTSSCAFDSFSLNSEQTLNNGSDSSTFNALPPVFAPTAQNSSLPDQDAKLLEEALNLFGYKDFRSGQREAITRVLRGDSTLVVLSTGSGKSLCYLLPAYVYAKKYPGSLTICVSPLVSLMEDQVQSIPSFLAGACLHTNMTQKQRDLVLDKVKQKKLQVLLVSPEAICGGLFGLLRNVHDLPPIAFACVDEVHCVSEWSHNFRPSYLRVCQILRERLKVKTILGLTATATNYTIRSVCEHLEIDVDSVIRGEIVPPNLRLSCSRDTDREYALITLLRSQRFEGCDSIIIYCTRREQCEKIATLIRTTLTEKIPKSIKENSRRTVSAACETYHAGMSAARRKSVQTNFMAGKIRIVVATVAFGMGIDKSDIRAVIHFNMPKTFESYIQEIGRAGRDGLPAECHLFLDNSKGKDICELKRHIFSNSIERGSLRKLLSQIFRPCTCQRTGKIRGLDESRNGDKKPCPGHEMSFSVEETVRDLDLPDENVETVLCYLERYRDKKGKKVIQIQPKCYHLCSIQSYGGTNLLKASARNSPALAAAIAMQKEKKKFKDDDVHVEFNFVEVARMLGWPSAQMRRDLKSLEWAGTQFDAAGNATRFRKSGILVEFSDLAYRMITPGTLSNEESDAVLDYLHERNTSQEKMELFQLYRIYQCLFSNSVKSVDAVLESYNEEMSDTLKKLILEYFNCVDVGVPPGWRPPTSATNAEKEETIRQDIRKLLQNHGDLEFSSRAIAKMFQGISSPCYPAETWSRNRAFWRRHIDVDFHYLCQIATEEIC